jgi:4-amino-4-deoxy-L-arabinose transferase-like glycosyltransferase
VKRFFVRLGVITAIGLVVRLVYVYARRDNALWGDAFVYHRGANLLVHGHGFIEPLQYLVYGHSVQAADHPPLYTLFLALPSALGLDTPLAHMTWSALLGCTTVVVTGLLGRRVGGERVGLIAAAIVAIAPNVWVYDGQVLSETLAILVATLVLLFAYRVWEDPSTARVCVLGAGCGAAALARSELILVVPALAWPVTLLAARATSATRDRFARAGLATIVALIVIAPWVGYNLSRFDHPVFLSSQLEATLAGANCADTYAGPGLGLITTTCLRDTDPFADQSDNAQIFRRRAWDFASAHKTRVPIVAGARIGRVLGVYRPGQQINFDRAYEGRERGVARAGLLNTYLVELGAIAGLVLWRRRDVPRFPLVVVPAIVVVTVALTYGTNRFRASAETSLAVLAAVAVDVVVQRIVERRKPVPAE